MTFLFYVDLRLPLLRLWRCGKTKVSLPMCLALFKVCRLRIDL